MYTTLIIALILVFIISALGTAVIDIIFRFLGKRGYLGNLYPNVRGGIPRAVGLIPFIILSFFFLPGFNSLILIIGVLHLLMMLWAEKNLHLELNGDSFQEA